MRWKNKSIIVMVLLFVMLTGCASKEDKEAAETFMKIAAEAEEAKPIMKAYEELSGTQKDLVENADDFKAAYEVYLLIDTSLVPSQSEYNNILEKYNELSSFQKEILKVDDYIEKYRDVDLQKINNLQDKINNVSKDTSYGELVSISSEYEAMPLKDKEAIDNYTVIKEAMELDEYDKAGVCAARFLKALLKNPNSLDIRSIRAIKSGGYYVVINYTAENGFGGTLSDSICVDVTTEYETGMITLAVFSGKVKESSNLNYGYYVKHDDNEHDLIPEKIMANL